VNSDNSHAESMDIDADMDGGIGPLLSLRRSAVCVEGAYDCCVPVDGAPLTYEQADCISGVLKALAHPTRLQLLSLLANEPGGEACVCTISAGFAVSAPTISHHLRKLREAGVLTCRRRGTWVYYRPVPGILGMLTNALSTSVRSTPFM